MGEVLAGPSSLYSSAPAFPSSYSSQTPTPSVRGAAPLRDGWVDPAAAKKEYTAEAKEDGLGAISPKSRGCSRRNLIIGLFILLVVVGAALGGALGATLGKHSSNDKATKTSSSVLPTSTSTTSSTTTTATSGAVQ